MIQNGGSFMVNSIIDVVNIDSMINGQHILLNDQWDVY